MPITDQINATDQICEVTRPAPAIRDSAELLMGQRVGTSQASPKRLQIRRSFGSRPVRLRASPQTDAKRPTI